jgi:hypothetical protein
VGGIIEPIFQLSTSRRAFLCSRVVAFVHLHDGRHKIDWFPPRDVTLRPSHLAQQSGYLIHLLASLDFHGLTM